MPEQLEIRIHGDGSLPTLIYLPGLHGNWTLVGNFRRALNGRLRFVEAAYPPTLTWSLEDYAAGVEAALAERGIAGGWVLAESFSSQVVWRLIARKQFPVAGLVLAGGFVRHPLLRGVRLAERVCGEISFSLLVRILFGYATVSRWRFRRSPETIRGIQEFIAGLTEQERQAARHRLHLVAESDPRAIAERTDVPVYGLSGLFDPIVPWFWVRRWLKRNCPSLRQYRVLWRADHNVLGTGAEAAAEQVVRWMRE
jgi:pimeloyl-ACP methyl ester carboxylesterase